MTTRWRSCALKSLHSMQSTCLVVERCVCPALALSRFPHPFFASVLCFPLLSDYNMAKHFFLSPVLFLGCIESSFWSSFQLINRTYSPAGRQRRSRRGTGAVSGRGGCTDDLVCDTFTAGLALGSRPTSVSRPGAVSFCLSASCPSTVPRSPNRSSTQPRPS